MNAIRPWLFIGKYRDTRDLSYLKANQIGAMLQLAERVEQPAITSCYLAVVDGEPLAPNVLRQGIDFVFAMRQQERRVLIACGAGISRSAAFATAVIREAEGIHLLDAVQVVKQHHNDTFPHIALWQSLCAYYGEDIPFLTLVRLLNTVR